MTDTTKLLPCPFCGGKAELNTWGNDRDGCHVAKVICDSCSASADSFETQDQAITAWNRRASPSPDLSAENARLGEALKQAQKALAMCIEPSKITGSTVQSAFANITAAEARARQALGDALGAP